MVIFKISNFYGQVNFVLLNSVQLGLLGAWRIAFGLMQSEHLHPLLADNNREHRQTAEQVQFENEIIFRNMDISSTILSTIRKIVRSVPKIDGTIDFF
jgi:hypothetical protein